MIGRVKLKKYGRELLKRLEVEMPKSLFGLAVKKLD
jgi:hypothetical protein